MQVNKFLWMAGAAFCVVSAWAVETRFWQHYDAGDYENAEFDKVSLRSDGRLTLAPSFQEVYETSAIYLWALAEDSRGRVYAGGGAPGSSTAKLFEIDDAGKGKVLAELQGLEIHALAVDRQDRLYAATSPDGKIYRVGRDGKPEVFYDPKAKYIWTMAFSPAGDLYVATGDKGEIHKVAPSGQGSVFFQTEETHARSLAVDSQGNLIAGTEPGGLIFRISPKGEGFVLFQTGKREVTAVAVASDGSIHAAAVGAKAPAALPALPNAPPQVPVAGQTAGRPGAPPPPTFTPAPSITGGSEVYRIDAEGSPRKVWQHASDVVYAIAMDANGQALLGTGNKGRIYRIDSARLHTRLVSSSSAQITAFQVSRKGGVLVAAANLGKVLRLGPAIEKEGTVESDALDAGAFAYWGRARFEGDDRGGKIGFETRTGNLDRPQKNWSAWSAVPLEAKAGRIGSPSARFLQYRLKLTAGSGTASPAVTLSEFAYLTKNVAPAVEQIEPTPPNYRFPAPVAPSLTTAPQTLSLPAVGQRRRGSSGLSIDTSNTSMNYSRGWAGARWKASDENGDTLVYKIEIRAMGDQNWKPLKDQLRETRYSFDASSYADGEYQVRVTASDSPDNPPAEALTASLESEAFLIDNTPPEISGLTAAVEGGSAVVRWKAKDARAVIEKAEYSVNGGDWLPALPVSKLADSLEHSYEVKIDRGTGELSVAVRVADEFENQAVAKTALR